MGKPNSQWVYTMGLQRKTWALGHQQQPVPQSSGHSCTPVGCRHAPIHRSLGHPHDPTPALRTATQKKMRAIPSSLWTSFGTAGSVLPIVSKSQKIDWLSKEGTKMRALGRADDPTTGAKETPGFHRPSMGKPNSQWVHRGRRLPWVISNNRFPNRLALLHTRGPRTRTHTSVVGSSPRPNARSQCQKLRAIPSSLWTSFGTPIVSKSQRD